MTMAKIDVPDEVYEKLAARAEEKGFDSCDEYINSVLKQVINKIEKKKQQQERGSYSKEEEEKVKNRLRALAILTDPERLLFTLCIQIMLEFRSF